jgi:hypothetical protein
LARNQAQLLAAKNFKISPSWCSKWLAKVGFSLRRVTTGKVARPAHLLKLETTNFVDRIAVTVAKHSIPPELVLNFDQTGLHLAPVKSNTFCETGSKQVVVRFAKDKRQVTALLAGTASGSLLQIQIIFQGKIFR